MKVNEIFESLQGEGIYTGADMTFIRFAGCSTECTQCDTQYAWDKDSGDEYDPARLFITVGGMRPTKICFTGGEPLEQEVEQLGNIMSSLARHSFDIHIETCGLIHPTLEILEHVNFWSISPKLSSMAPLTIIHPQQLQTLYQAILMQGKDHGQWKFVVDTEEDMKEIAVLLYEAFESDVTWPIVLQPLNTRPGPIVAPKMIDYGLYFRKLKEIKSWAEIYLDGLDWRVMPQLHYLMWGGVAGV